ncbi:MAG: hypothetical protein HHAS10_11150 [Candidatus Altimarinota bacterium]
MKETLGFPVSSSLQVFRIPTPVQVGGVPGHMYFADGLVGRWFVPDSQVPQVRQQVASTEAQVSRIVGKQQE